MTGTCWNSHSLSPWFEGVSARDSRGLQRQVQFVIGDQRDCHWCARIAYSSFCDRGKRQKRRRVILPAPLDRSFTAVGNVIWGRGLTGCQAPSFTASATCLWDLHKRTRVRFYQSFGIAARQAEQLVELSKRSTNAGENFQIYTRQLIVEKTEFRQQYNYCTFDTMHITRFRW